MDPSAEEIQSSSYYLLYQFSASLILALVGLMLGLFIAWFLWGHYKFEVERARARKQDLKIKLQNLQS